MDIHHENQSEGERSMKKIIKYLLLSLLLGIAVIMVGELLYELRIGSDPKTTATLIKVYCGAMTLTATTVLSFIGFLALDKLTQIKTLLKSREQPPRKSTGESAEAADHPRG